MAKLTVFLVFVCSLFSDEIKPQIDQNTWVLLNIDELPTEAEIPNLVKSAGAVFGLTAKEPPLSVQTLHQLTRIGIAFTFPAPIRPNLETRSPIQWEGGVLFLSDFNKRADVFQKWLELAQFRPSKIVIIDGGKEDFSEVEKQMEELRIPTFLYRNPRV